MRTELRLVAVASIATLSLFAVACGGQKDAFKIGVITDCDGVFSAFSPDVLAGAELPLLERGGKLAGPQPSGGVVGAKVGGRRVELRQGCGEITYMTQLIESTRRLIEGDGVDVVVAPMLGQTEGIVLRDLARRYPNVVFLLANSYAQESTLRDPAPNLFRFVADGAQATAGLGTYAYRNLGWRHAAVVLPDNAFAWPQAAGFVAEFCALGGHIQRLAAPESAAGSVVSRLPRNADGVAFMPSVFADTVGFAAPYAKLQPDLAGHLVLGPGALSFADPKLLAKTAPLLRGVVLSGGSYDAHDPAWRSFKQAFLLHFRGLSYPSSPGAFPLVLGFYDSVEATLRALEQARGGGEALIRALAGTSFNSPNGPLRLDRDRQAIISNTLSQIEVGAKGAPSVRTLRVLRNVEQTFGGYFGPSTPTPTVSRPVCHKATPPAWAR